MVAGNCKYYLNDLSFKNFLYPGFAYGVGYLLENAVYLELRRLGYIEGGNLAASKIRNLECPSYEICLIDYGCGKFNRKIHIMEQYP